MREIKFRVWEKPGVLLQGKEEGSKVFEGRMWNDNDPKFWASCLMNTKDEYVLMQYTGLKDKNGKEIYEGDILALFQGTQKSEVFYKNGAFWVIAQISGGYPESEHLLCNLLDTSEIIGNIYENPELIN